MIKSRNSVLIAVLMSLFPFCLFALTVSPDSADFKSSAGKIIRNIYINNIDVSGPSIEDGKGWQEDIFGKIGNTLHTKTKTWTIKDILLFKEGQELDPQSIEDSERLLRSSGYFYDARIIIKPAGEPGEVDVFVTTKDKWTLDPTISYNPKKKNGYAGLKDRNFLGIGHSIGVIITHDEDTFIGWGGLFNYSINNIKGSFVNASLNLESNHKSNLFQLNLNRSFSTSHTRWAGGLDLTWHHDDFRFIEGDSIIMIPNSYDSQDLWIGRSFPAFSGSRQFKMNPSIILSFRYFRKHYSIRPQVTSDSNKIFENNRLYLISLGAINREFYKTFFVDEFGVTEDIPVGGMVSFTTGSDAREFYNRWYFGMQTVYSTNSNRLGYISGNFETGTFIYAKNWEQTTIKLDLIYHSPLFLMHNWKARFFFQNNYILGFRRFEGEELYLDKTTGMPGFIEHALPGVKRNVMDLEMRLFTPYNVLGFVIGGIVFADFGMIAGTDQKLLSSRIYQGYGIGLRTKNESISRTSFELAVVYNPYNPGSGSGNTEIIFAATFALGARDFNFNEPGIVEFSKD